MSRSKKRKKTGNNFPVVQEMELDELKAIVEKSKSSALSESDHGKLMAAMNTLVFLSQEIQAKDASISRLRRIIFGPSSERTKDVLDKETSEEAGAASDPKSAAADGADAGSTSKPAAATAKPDGEAVAEVASKAKGHGRNSADAYRKAERVSISNKSLKPKDPCPECKGTLYLQSAPALLIRITGVAPLAAKVYELERLRCNLCGIVITAEAPPGVGDAKYDATAACMIALLKYGCGLPFHRLERLQKDLGIPLPSSTQWDVVEKAADLITPAHQELIRQAAQGDVIHNDDTVMKILNLATPLATKEDTGRKGIYTTGIVSLRNGQKIAIFFTGNQHAGENLEDVLKRRSAELTAPIQMCDALSHNTSGEFDTLVANCIAHARRKFVDIVVSFPQECEHVLDAFGGVYRNDAEARKLNLTPDERLKYHQENSAQSMADLEDWMQHQLDDKLVEPNSVLGSAIQYLKNHWTKLTLFLTEPGAPLDNNICERALKKAILHRKNALFFRTRNGARVGDLFMSLIHTVELCKEDPFEYITALQHHHQAMSADPAAWMPWNFREALAAARG